MKRKMGLFAIGVLLVGAFFLVAEAACTNTTWLSLCKPAVGDTGWGVNWNANADKIDDMASGATAMIPQIKGYALASLPAAGPAGRLVRVTDDVRGAWMDQGAQWFGLNGEVANAKEFGATGDGATDDKTNIQAAITAAGSGGLVLLPPPAATYKLDSNLSAPSGTLIEYGNYSGAGAVVGERSLRQRILATPTDALTDFGSGFKAQYQLHGRTETTHAGEAIATAAIVRKASGSGTNGPSVTDMALLLTAEKTDFLTSTVQGEITGLYVIVRQGQKGDSSGLLIDLEKVEGDTQGGTTIEVAAKWINSSQVVQMDMHSLVAFLEGAGGPAASSGYGFYTEARIDTIYSAYHADQMETANSATWSNFLTYTKDRTAASMIYNVDGAGRTYGGVGTASLPGYSFIGDPDTGIYWPSADAMGFASGGLGVYFINSSGMHSFTGTDSMGKALLWLQQPDLSEEFIEFNGTVAVGNPIEAVGAKSLTVTNFVRISINGTLYYIQVGSIS